MAQLAYFFSTFPTLSETLALEQVKATRRLGLDFIVAANRRPPPGQYHPQDQYLAHQTFYLTPVRPWPYAAGNLKALVLHPRWYLKALKLAVSLKNGPGTQIGLNLGHLAGAAVLGEYLKRQGVRHIHVHYAFGAAEVAVFLATVSGLPYSLSIHGSDVLLPNPLFEAKLGRARFIVSNCRFHLKNLRRRFPSLGSQRFYVVPGGVDFTASPWDQATPVSSGQPLRLLNVARLVPVKAQEVLIQACRLLENQGIPVDCRLVGDGPRRAALQDLINDLGLQDAVCLWGPCHIGELAGLYDWSQVVVLSSHSEGTPMTIIEAMAKARAVVAPNLTALPEMVRDGVTGFLFQPGAAADLAAKLAALAHHPGLLPALGAAGRQRAAHLFDLKRNAALLLRIFSREIPGLTLRPSEAMNNEPKTNHGLTPYV